MMEDIMTQQQKLKEVVEATGGKWYICQTCLDHEICPDMEEQNPSPSDLNALFDLAEKLEVIGIGFDRVDNIHAKFWTAGYNHKTSGNGDTPAEALLNALHEAVKK